MKLPNRAIVVEVEGGVVTNVYANGHKVVLVVDHDAKNVGNSSTGQGWVACDDPKHAESTINRIVARKLRDLA
jgi:hypothetical protein